MKTEHTGHPQDLEEILYLQAAIIFGLYGNPQCPRFSLLQTAICFFGSEYASTHDRHMTLQTLTTISRRSRVRPG